MGRLDRKSSGLGVHLPATLAGRAEPCQWAWAPAEIARASRKAATADVVANPASNMMAIESN
jgi:hypothetical protein